LERSENNLTQNNNMKKYIITSLLAIGLLINAAFAGNSAKLGYTSDFFYRGVQKSEEAVQSSILLESELSGLKMSAHACTNQAINNGADSYHLGLGGSKSFADGLLSVYAGLNHFEDKPGEAISEFQLSLTSGSLLKPSLSAYRDLDDSLYTVEFSVSHSFDLDAVDLNVEALAGNTDLTNQTDRSYYSVGADVSKSVSENADLSVGVDYVDADDIDREFVFGTSLTLSF
tara:strand:- start:126 stop:815 length:690 start_codon:yes stop_codon:yes gene_type:complete